jgi:hypothetical protein
VPLAETLLAGWLLSQAGLRVPAGALTVAPVVKATTCSSIRRATSPVSAQAVPFARDADHIVSSRRRFKAAWFALVPRANCRIDPAENIAGEPRDDVVCVGSETCGDRRRAGVHDRGKPADGRRSDARSANERCAAGDPRALGRLCK